MELQPRVPHSLPLGPALLRGPGFTLGGAIWPGGEARRRPAALHWGRPGCRPSLPSLFFFCENSGRAGRRPRTASADRPAPADGTQRAEGGRPKSGEHRPATSRTLKRARPYMPHPHAPPQRTQCKAFFTLLHLTAKKRVFPLQPSFFLYYSSYIIQIVFFSSACIMHRGIWLYHLMPHSGQHLQRAAVALRRCGGAKAGAHAHLRVPERPAMHHNAVGDNRRYR